MYLLEVHLRLECRGKEAHGLMLQVVEGADAAHGQALYLIIFAHADAAISLRDSKTCTKRWLNYSN